MRYFLDTEFYERPTEITLISLGLVSEEGREYYAESFSFDWKLCDPDGPFKPDQTQEWLWKNVRPGIGPLDKRKANSHIGYDVIEFIGDDTPEFWGYYCDYDWVVFCWLFGRMIDLPRNFPMYCRDLKQVMVETCFPDDNKPKQKNEHNALADALWNRDLFRELQKWTTGMQPRFIL